MFDDEAVEGLMEGFSDAADILAANFNEFLMSSGDYNFVEPIELVELLRTYVTAKELSNHMTNDFTRGLLVGRILSTVEALHADEKEEEETDGEEA